MKNKLFLFGDSFTYGVGCRPECEYYQTYKTDTDDVWFNIIAKELDLEIKNYGMGLNSNDKVLDDIIDVYDDINTNDYVIIEKGFSHRFDIPNIDNNKLITIAPNCKNLLINLYRDKSREYSQFELNSIDYIATIFDSELISKRQIKRFNFIKKMIELKNVRQCLTWDITDYMDRKEYTIIVEETNGMIKDYHWTFSGNKNFAYKLLSFLKKNE